MQILNSEHQRATRRELTHQSLERLKRLVFDRLRRWPDQDISLGLHGQQVQQIRCCPLQSHPELLQPVIDFAADILVAVTNVNLEVLLNKVNDGEIGQPGAIRVTAAVEPGAVSTGKRLTKLIQQARFAQPGVANDRDGLATPLLGQREAVPEQRQFTLPPNQTREASLTRHVNAREAATLAPHPVGAHLPGQPLDADQSQVITVEVASHQFISLFRKLDRARCGGLFHARRQIDRVADGFVVHT